LRNVTPFGEVKVIDPVPLMIDQDIAGFSQYRAWAIDEVDASDLKAA
jgi:hypothetical protein